MDHIAYCGLFCGACGYRNAALTKDPRYIANVTQKTQEELDRILNETPCPGCRLENKCCTCALRDCAVEKGVNTCGDCCEFPCAELDAFHDDGVPHHGQCIANLREIQVMGEAAWAKRQAELWACAPCGAFDH